MIAVDTNIVVRLLTADDPRQAEIARRLFSDDTIFISRTVLLEVAWVLQATYSVPAGRVVDAFARLLGLDGVVIESRDQVGDALDLARAGMQFADALHVVASPPGCAFATFDRSLSSAARRAASKVPVSLL